MSAADFAPRVQATPSIRNQGRELFSTAKLTTKISALPVDGQGLFSRPQWPKRTTWVRSFGPTLLPSHLGLQRTG